MSKKNKTQQNLEVFTENIFIKKIIEKILF